MKYYTAQDARKATSYAQQFRHLGATLTRALEQVKQSAESGNTEYIGEGYGILVDLTALVIALQTLGFQVEDISNKQTPGGSRFLDRSLRISW